MLDPRVRRWWPLLVFVAVAAVHALALPVDAMDVDAAEYAHIAREMLSTKSFLVVHDRGLDYLDKPPLTFWLTALSYALFGVSTIASKIPSFLAAALAVVSTGKLVRMDAGPRAGFLAALFLATCQALFLITNDCRTDTVLLGMVVFALWMIRSYQRTGTRTSLVLSGFAVGLALLAKGPIGAAVPLFAAGSDVVARREWKRLLTPAPLVAGLVAFGTLTPMLVGLHRQFGWNGWRFFFWTQSFGRITGSSMWRDDTGPLFFTHTMLWAFLPWTPILCAALYAALRNVIRGRLRESAPGEGFLLGGFLLTFVALSLSHYKLPHYIFVVLPFTAALAGRWCDAFLERPGRAHEVLRGFELVVCAALWGLGAWLSLVAFPLESEGIAITALVLLGVTLALVFRAPNRPMRLLGPALASILGANVLLSGNFYPQVLRFQSASMAVHVAHARGIPVERIACYRAREYSLDFAVNRDLVEYHRLDDLARDVRAGPRWIYTDADGLDALRKAPVALGEAIALADYHVTRLTPKFLSSATRAQAISTRYLVEVHAPAGSPAASAASGL